MFGIVAGRLALLKDATGRGRLTRGSRSLWLLILLCDGCARTGSSGEDETAGTPLNGSDGSSMIRQGSWPKHFLYISQEKVDALYAQLTMRERRKIAQQFEVDLKFVKGRVSVERMPESIYLKLRVVVEHLYRENSIGSIDGPAQYLAGSFPMSWGVLSGASDDLSANVVFFGTRLATCSFGLGGSASNVFGEVPGGPRRSGSNAPALLDALRAADPNSPKDLLAARLLQGREGRADGWDLDTVEKSIDALPGVTQEVEFVARRLIAGVSQDGKRTVVLGSPLYVSLVD